MRLSSLVLLCSFLAFTLNGRGNSLSAGPDALLAEAGALLEAGKAPEAIPLFQKAVGIFKAEGRARDWVDAHKAFSKIYRNKLGDVAQGVEYLKAALAVEREFPAAAIDSSTLDALAWAYVNLGYLYAYQLEDQSVALRYYNDAADLFQQRVKREDPTVASYVYREMGILYIKFGDYQAAEVVLSQAKNAALRFGENALAAEFISDLGVSSYWSEGPSSALQHYESGLSLPGINISTRGLLLINKCKALADLGRYEEARTAAREARRAFEQAIARPEWAYLEASIPSCLVHMAETYMMEGNFPKSEQLFLSAAKQIGSLKGQGTARQLAKCYFATGTLYQAWQKHEAALEYFQKALSALMPDENLGHWSRNPPISSLFPENTIMDALSEKANTLFKWYGADGDSRKLELALECHELVFKVEELLRRRYYYESSRLFNVEEARARSAGGIKIALELLAVTGDEKYKETALAFAERTRSTLLLEAFYQSKAEAVAGIPESVVEEGRRLSVKIAGLEEEAFQARQGGDPAGALSRLEPELLEANKAYNAWVENIERQYPKYYQLKYDVRTLASDDIRRQLLPGGEAFIEYFVGAKQAYAFVITSDRFEVVAIEKDFPMEEWVARLRDDITHFQYPTYDKSRLCASYSDYAYRLYDKLFRPLEALGLPERLIVVTSGVLSLLPFDALLTAPAQACDFQQYPYLIRRYDISYAYSAALQAALKERPVGNHRFAGFAPAFDGRGGLNRLEYNISLLEVARGLLGGALFTGDNATVARLQEVAGSYGLLHFSSHAQANTEEGDFSFIVFSDGRGGYDSLYVKDVYLLPLQAEMAVLSACETSAGTLYSGEGVISLARGFLYAGANSVITTLWSINDGANSQLMEAYYGFLKQGYSKSEALRLAKLRQIEEAGPFHAHPAYWAAFTPIGNMRPVFTPLWVKLAIGAVGLGLVLALVLARVRGKGKVEAEAEVEAEEVFHPNRPSLFSDKYDGKFTKNTF